MSLPEWPEWRAAIEKEVLGLIAADLWSETPRSEVPSGTAVIPSHFLFKIKFRSHAVFVFNFISDFYLCDKTSRKNTFCWKKVFVKEQNVFLWEKFLSRKVTQAGL